MNHVYRLIWNRAYGMFVPAAELTRANGKCASGKTAGPRKGHAARSMSLGALVFLLSSQASYATTFLDLTGGIAGWTTSGTVSVLNSTDTITFQDNNVFSLTPATGESMVKISAQGAAEGSVNSVLGLSANTIEGFLNNGNGHVTNFGLLTNTLSFGIGTYTFSWAYAAEDYQPYNDGSLFSLVGAGTQSVVSLARNGSSPTDTSGPSANTMILGSYGSTAWETTTFTISTAGSYQIGFASYNWNDTSLEPNLYVGRIEGTFTGTPVTVAGGPVVMDGTNGNVSPSVYDTSSDAYAEPSLTFDGGTLQYTANTTTNKDATLDSGGGTIDTNGNAISYTGLVSGAGAFTKAGNGTLTLTNSNSYTGLTTIDDGTLALQGSGSIAASSGVNNNGSLDISGTTAGASITTMSGNGTVALGSKTLTLTDASDTFSGVIGGTGGLTVTDGTETLSGINTYSGATSIAGGATISLSGAGSIANSSVVNNNGTLNIAATTSGAAIVSLSGNSAGTVVLGSRTLTLTDANDNFAGVISGTGGLSVADGTETLSGSNTYSGATSIANGGTIVLNGAGSITASSGVADNGTLDISGTTTGASIKTLSGTGIVGLGSKILTLTNATDTFDGVIGGTGGVNVSGGTETLTGINSYTGTTAIGASGTINLSGAGSIAASSGVTNNGVLNISATNSGAALTTLAGSGTVGLGSKTLTLSNASNTFTGVIGGSGNLTIAGGTETLSGINTYTGATNLASGATLNLNSAGSIAASSGIANNGLFDISGTTAGASVKTLSGNGVVGLGSKFLTLTNANDTFVGVIGGTGGVNVSNGTQTLTGVNTYTGATTVAAGAAIHLSGAGSMANSGVVNASGTLDISATNSGAAITSLSGAGTGTVVLGSKALTLTNANDTYAGVVTGTGSVSLVGGMQTLNGINTYSGATSIASGATINLTGAGSMANSSGLANNGIFNIAGTTSGAALKTLSGNGAVGLGSKTLTLTNANDIFAGNITGTGGVTISGGAQTYNNTNSYTGATSINTGATINLSGAGNIATSSGVTNNGLFDISGVTSGASIKTLSGGGTVALGSKALTLTNANDIFAGVINGAGSLAITTGTTTLTGVNTYSGATSIGSGSTIAIANAGSIANSNSVLNNGTLDISSATTGASLKSLSGSGTVALGSKALTLTNANDSFSGVIGGTGGVNVTDGNQTLVGINTYLGTTSIGIGATINLSDVGSIATSSGITNNGWLDISGSTTGVSLKTLAGNGAVGLGTKSLTLTNANDSFTGVIGGTGSLVLSSGTETLAGVNTYTGSTSIGNGSTIAISNAGSIANSNSVVSNGRLDISGATTGITIKTLSGTGTVGLGEKLLALSDANDTFAGVIDGTGSVTIDAGTETLSGENTYTGTTSIADEATLKLKDAGSVAHSFGIDNDGRLDISEVTSSAAIQTLAGSGHIALGDKTLVLTNASHNFTGVIDGIGNLNIAGGIEALSGVNTYTGHTSIVSGANLVLANAGSVTTSRSINNNGIFDISTTNTGATINTLTGTGLVNLGDKALTLSNASDDFAGVIAGTGSVDLFAGEEQLSGINEYSGATSIANDATLRLAGAGSIATSSRINNAGLFDISATDSGAAIKTLAGGGTVNLGNKTLVLTHANDNFAGVIAGNSGLSIIGGTETLSGVNTYLGGTHVANGGTVVVASDTSLGDAAGGLSFDGGTLQTTASLISTRAISLVGDAAFTQDAGTVLTATGQISGDGHLYKDGDGTLILSGDNRYWGAPGSNALGGLTIDSGLVEVTNSYGLGYGLVTVNSGMITTTVDIVTGQTVAVTGDVELHTDADTTTNLTGTVVSTDTSSCFNKTGEGTLVMSGNALLTNGTCVLEGNLYANGVLESNVSVDAGAMLRGTGVILGPVNVQGTLAPGNSPGTLVVNGTVTMTAGSAYQEDINGTGTGSGAGNYSRLIVTGAGNQFIAAGSALAPNLVNVTGSDTYTPYVPALGDSFRIVTAEGGIVGRFNLAQPAGLATDTRLVAFYDVFDSNSIDLRVIPTSYARYLLNDGGNKNAQSMGGALDQLLNIDQNAMASIRQDELAYEVAGLDASSLSTTATALSGEVHGALAAVAPQADQWLEASVARQLTAAGMTTEVTAHRAVWMDATSHHSKWSADEYASAFTANRQQLAIGFDLLGSDSGLFGVGLSTADVDVSAAGGTGSVNTHTGFIYGRYAIGGTVLDGIAAYGANTWQTQRAEPLAQTAALTTKTHGHTGLLSAGVRWPMQMEAISLAPYGRVTWQQSTRAAFDENAAMPDALTALAAPKYSESGVHFTAGLMGGSAQQNPLAAPFTYQLNVGLSHDSGDLVRPTVQASLVGIDTQIVAPQVSRFSAQGNLTGTARLSEQAYVYVGVTAEARRGKSDDAGLNAGIRASF